MVGHAHAATGTGFWPLALMWWAMMAAMMAPTVWPWVRTFHRLSGAEPGAQVGAATRFAAGYLLAWLGFSLAVIAEFARNHLLQMRAPDPRSPSLCRRETS